MTNNLTKFSRCPLSNVLTLVSFLVPGKQVDSTTLYIAVDCQNQIYQVQFERFIDANGQVRDST
ncbi:MAG: hypothetical protein RLP02_27860 [Coleofasciculus sp. C2-GNP5-27]